MKDSLTAILVLYELICKKHPYFCQNKDILWDKIKNNQISIDFTYINNDVYKSIIKNMLSIDVGKRMTWSNIYDMELEYNYHNTDDEIFQIDNDESKYFDPELGYNIHQTDLSNISKVEPYPNIISSQSLLIKNNQAIDTPIISSSDPVMKGKYFEKYFFQRKF